MAGKIVADTLEHSTAGSVDTQYVVDGSAKHWVHFNGQGTIAIYTGGSLNTSSLTDNGTGNYDVFTTNNFSGADNNFVSGNSSGNQTRTFPQASNEYMLNLQQSNGTAEDRADVGGVWFGELA